MDSLRGQEETEAEEGYEHGAIEAPPAFDTQERRMHVRAYNYWVSLLGSRCLPSIEDLNPEDLEDFSPHSVLLDFSMGLENPAIIYLGSALREECGITGPIERIDEVPPRSLLSRLTDHYLQIIANAAPVGFEAEFTNQRGVNIMYRGILMPFSSDDETIDFIYGVINWKEVASDSMVEQLGEEMKAALSSAAASYPAAPIWADGPSATSDFEDEDEDADDFGPKAYDAIAGNDFGFDELVQDMPGHQGADVPQDQGEDGVTAEAPQAPASPASPIGDMDDDDDLSFDELDLSAFLAADRDDMIADTFAELEPGAEPPAEDIMTGDEKTETVAASAEIETNHEEEAHLLSMVSPLPLHTGPSLGEQGDVHDDDLASALEIARRSAVEVRECDARSRAALYRAISHAYDFALSARAEPRAYEAMLEAAGIAVQERAPMTAIIKLVFGADYEKTRVAEYALALDYALDKGIARGTFAVELGAYEGGLKGLVQDVRAARNGESENAAIRPVRRLERAVRKLGHAKPALTAELPFGELGLAVVVARREADGSISLLAGVGLQDKAAQKVMIAASKTV